VSPCPALGSLPAASNPASHWGCKQGRDSSASSKLICQQGQDRAPYARRPLWRFCRTSSDGFVQICCGFIKPARKRVIDHADYQMPTVRKGRFRPGWSVPRLRLPDCERRNQAAKRVIAPIPGRSAGATDYSGPPGSPWPQLGPADPVDALGEDDLDIHPVAGVAAIGAGAIPLAHPVARVPRNFNLEDLRGRRPGALLRCATRRATR